MKYYFQSGTIFIFKSKLKDFESFVSKTALF